MSAVGTKLDANQVIKQVYDEANNRLRTSATFTGTLGISASGGDNIAIKDESGTNAMNINPDGSIDANIVNPININIDASTGDNLAIKDETGTNSMMVNPDGSIDVNVVSPINVNIDASTGDNLLIVGTENGLTGGIQHTARIDSNLDLRVGISDGNNKAGVNLVGQLSVIDSDANTLLNDIKTKLNGTLSVDDDASQLLLNSIYTVLNSGIIEVNDANTQTLITTANTILNSILTQLNSGTLKVDDDQTQNLLTNVLSQLQAGGIAIGTEDGTATGTQRVFVNNLRKMIMDSADRAGVISYLDISDKKNRRIDKIDYTSATFPGITASKQFTYTLVSGDYVRTSPGNWYLI